MRENLQYGHTGLNRLFWPMQLLIWVEIALGVLLTLYTSGILHTGTATNRFALLGLVVTLMQPKYQFGMVGEWKSRARELWAAPPEELPRRLADLQTIRREGVEQMRVWLMVSPALILLELGAVGTATLGWGVLFGAVCYLFFELWQRRFVRWLDGDQYAPG